MRELEIKKDGEYINSNKEWLEKAGPKSKEKQWKEKHSASELADYCLFYKGFVPKDIDNYLNELHIRSEKFDGEPECKTSLKDDGFGSGGDRQHDLLMWNKEMVVGIEAKATEDLDEYVTNKYKDPDTENHTLRYPGLCKRLLGKEIGECSNIRYQLLSATAGTLIEARNKKVKKAALIIVLFKSDITTTKHIDETKEDIDNFVKCFDKKPNGSYIVKFMPEIDFYVKFIEVDINTYH